MSPRWVALCAHRVRWHIPRRICGEQARRRGRRVRETARYSRPLAVIPAARHRPATRCQAAHGPAGWWSSGERRREPLGMGRLSHACMPYTTLGVCRTTPLRHPASVLTWLPPDTVVSRRCGVALAAPQRAPLAPLLGHLPLSLRHSSPGRGRVGRPPSQHARSPREGDRRGIVPSPSNVGVRMKMRSSRPGSTTAACKCRQ
jgi:hypothetical protein